MPIHKTSSLSKLSLLQRLILRCAAMPPGLLTTYVSCSAIALSVPVGLGLWQALLWAGIPSLTLMIILTGVIVAPPLAGFLAITLAWGWRRQEELAKQEQALRRQEFLLTSAQRLAKLGYWQWDIGTGRYLLSRDMCPLYGIPVDNPYLDHAGLLEIVHPDDHTALHEALRILIEERRYQEVEYRVQGPDGIMRTVWVDGRCEYDRQGNVVAMFGVIQDITDRKRIEEELRQALAQTETASKAKSDFLASMSHELRTPLNAVLGFSEMIRDQWLGPVGNARYLEYANDIHSSGSHLLSLISDLLDVSKIEAGHYELYEGQIELSSLIEQSVRMVRPSLEKKEQFIEFDPALPKLLVWVDERAMQQVLLNLLSNAIKFSHIGGKIRIAAAVASDWLTIEVEDHGIGIPEDKLIRIGEPFFRVHTEIGQTTEGTGIGLAVTRSLVELHGGDFSVSSRYGEGTRIIIRLPASRILPQADAIAV